MRIVTVQARIRDDALQPYLEASVANARASVGTEAGCHRFDVFRDAKDPNRIGYNEVYKDDDAFAAHGETEHFAAWLAATDGMADGDMTWATCRSLSSDATDRYPTLTMADAKSPAGNLHVFQGRLKAFSSEVDGLIEALADQAAQSLRLEPGCLRFDVSQKLDDPAEIWIYEVYADRAAFKRVATGEAASVTRERMKGRHEPLESISGPNIWPPDTWRWGSQSEYQSG